MTLELEERMLLICGEPLARTSSLKSISFQLKSVNFLLDLQRLVGALWNHPHVEQLWQGLGHNRSQAASGGGFEITRASALVLWAPRQLAYKTFLGVSFGINPPLFDISLWAWPTYTSTKYRVLEDLSSSQQFWVCMEACQLQVKNQTRENCTSELSTRALVWRVPNIIRIK